MKTNIELAAIERKLARLIWPVETKVAFSVGYGGAMVPGDSYEVWHPIRDSSSVCPKWARENAAAFKLMVEHADVCASALSETIKSYEKGWITVDKEAAVRLAIVLAVIAKLEKRGRP